MRHGLGGEEGFGLAVAVMALVVIGALVTGGFMAASNEGQIGVGTRFSSAAFYAAERGIHDVLGTRTRPYLEELEVGQPDQLTPVPLNVGGLETQYTVTIRRLNDHIFLIQSTGEVLSGGRYAGATRHLAKVVRLTNFTMVTDRAVTLGGGLRIRGQSAVNGRDTIPPSWVGTCDNAGTLTGILAIDTLRLDYQPGQGGGQGIHGDPPKDEDSDLGWDDFFDYGDVDFDGLAAMAEKVYPHNTTLSSIGPSLTLEGACDVADDRNWGDPVNVLSPCHFYFPIIYAEGDLQLGGMSSTAVGQGILLVEGNLHLGGNFEFAGAIVVKGTFTSTGTNTIIGSLSAWSGDDHELGASAAGNTRIQLSTCALERASKYNTRASRAFPLHERSWLDLSGLGWSS